MAELKDDIHKSNKSVQFVFVGSPLLSISAKCSPTMLRKYGLKPDDCIRAKQEHDALFKTLFNSSDSHITPGGPALNSARIAKWILGERGKVAFAGCVGHDEHAEWITKTLMSECVEPLLVFHDEEPTGSCACLLVSEKDRSMCTRHGASAFFVAEHLVMDDIQTHLENSNCIFVVGYFLAHSPDVVYNLAKMCSPTQIFTLSLSSEYICRDHAERLLNVLPRVDVLLGNEVEMMTFASALGASSEHSVTDAAQLIANDYKKPQISSRIVIVTRGPEPVIVAETGKKIRSFRVPQNISVVDSVGCGDALAGGFLAEYILTRDLSLAVQIGIQAAVAISQTEGCNPPLNLSCKTEDFIDIDEVSKDSHIP